MLCLFQLVHRYIPYASQALQERINEVKENAPDTDTAALTDQARTNFEQLAASALNQTLSNQEQLMLHMQELHYNEDMRLVREEVLEKVLATVKSAMSKRQRSVTVSSHTSPTYVHVTVKDL